MPTPLYDAVKKYADQEPFRFHMPGHKGGPVPLMAELKWMTPIDLTELPPTGNLYEGGEPFASAQALWAKEFGFEYCQFLTGGSTQGIHTGLALCCPPGSKVLVDRNCHRAVFNAMALLDLEPIYLERPWLGEESLIGPISPETVENMLCQCPKIKTVCITAPTYAGVLSDVGTISRLVHAHGGKLFVDGAHGAHLPFLGQAPFWEADGVVVSAHKTLPTLGQGALLFTNGMDPDRVRQLASVFGTSSPSYPIMASMDTAREWMVKWGHHDYRRTALRVAQLREQFPSLREKTLSLDPTRFVLSVQNGPAFTRALEKRGVYPEMEDGGHVVFICTPFDNSFSLSALERRLEELREQMGPCPPIPAPPLPEQAMSPRQALFAPSRVWPLEDCEGEVAACQIAPYPPGVPVVAPGEVISKKSLAYLKQIGYNIKSEVRIAAL